MIYHTVAINTPLSDGLLTYSHPHALSVGMRVAVPLRNKLHSGIVWASDVAADIDAERILPVHTVFADEVPLPEYWRGLMAFAARYYHYPVGQAVLAALPPGLREPAAVEMPQPPLYYRLSREGRAQKPPPARFRKQAALWQALSGADGLPLAVLKQIHARAPKLVAEWSARGLVETAKPAVPAILPSENALNTAQHAAAAQIHAAEGGFKPFLLYGITGSGKTEVYFDAMEKVLASGRQVLFLLPEISLTPQLLKRVEARFGAVPSALLHSRTAAGRRTQDYLRAMLGQAKLVIGTRLAVFTPLPDLGLVVVDEEHDTSFKQDNELRYNARDLAVWRAQQSGCPVVLGSATPSLESWNKAQTGAYALLELPLRARSAAKPPQVDLLDTGRLKLDNGFSPQALKLLQDNFEQGGMSLVYLNRRGFSPALFCGDCGHTFGCPHCAAKLVLHLRARQLRCHHCGFRRPVPVQCPDCGNQDLTAVGQGTQRIEETLRTHLPQARIERVDRDSTSGISGWADLYGRIASDGIDILVGTQMLAKGHDFARLNLVVVLNADGSLYSADFRAPERLFAELMQVSGRAGRAEKPGRVLIQTRLPAHPVFAAVKAQDYRLFADKESAEREMFAMPPFGFQTAIRADAEAAEEAVAFLNGIRDSLAGVLPENVSVFGATPMLMARLAGRGRAQLFLESQSRKALHQAVGMWTAALRQHPGGGIRWSIDVDPQEM